MWIQAHTEHVFSLRGCCSGQHVDSERLQVLDVRRRGRRGRNSGCRGLSGNWVGDKPMVAMRYRLCIAVVRCSRDSMGHLGGVERVTHRTLGMGMAMAMAMAGGVLCSGSAQWRIRVDCGLV